MLAHQHVPFASTSAYVHKDAPPTHLYYQSPHAVEVIQLVEVPPPPPRSHPYTSTFASSSFASSSSGSSSSDEDDESVCSSYCSSVDELPSAESEPVYDDTYKTRLSRVLAWREGFAHDEDAFMPPAPPSSPASSTSSTSTSSSLKRKADGSDLGSDDDMASQSSKRSRSHPPSPPEAPRAPWAQRRLSAHSCPACDADFASDLGLRQHGSDAGCSDACRQAVEYGFEP